MEFVEYVHERKRRRDATDGWRASVWGSQTGKEDRDRERAELTEMKNNDKRHTHKKNNDSKLGGLFVIKRSLTETFRTSRGRVGQEGGLMYSQPGTQRTRHTLHMNFNSLDQTHAGKKKNTPALHAAHTEDQRTELSDYINVNLISGLGYSGQRPAL